MNMGYIAPVTPYDYIQYANRTVAAARKERKIPAVSTIPTVTFQLNETSGWESYVKGQYPNWPEKNRRPKYAAKLIRNKGNPNKRKKLKQKLQAKA